MNKQQLEYVSRLLDSIQICAETKGLAEGMVRVGYYVSKNNLRDYNSALIDARKALLNYIENLE